MPLTVTPEAAARIAALGIQVAVDRMLDYARQHFPDLDRSEIILYDRYELGDEPGLAIEAYSRRPYDAADRTDDEMIGCVESSMTHRKGRRERCVGAALDAPYG